MNTQNACSSALVVLLALTGLPAIATNSDDTAWPCEQALVLEVPAAVVWDGPSVDGLQGQWKSDPGISALVQRLTARDTDPTAYEPLIEAYTTAIQPPAERDRRLTLLFAGVLEVLNADRSKLNAGILRYSRDQQRRAEVLDKDLTEMVRLESDGSDEARRRLEALSQRIELEQRIFDDREKSLTFLCARPRVVEQRIGDLARTIATHLE